MDMLNSIHPGMNTGVFSRKNRIKEKIKNGESINGWVHQHIPSDVISVTGLDVVDIEVKPFDFDNMQFGSEDISFENGKISGKFHTASTIDEFAVSDLIDVMAEICSSAVHAKYYEQSKNQ